MSSNKLFSDDKKIKRISDQIDGDTYQILQTHHPEITNQAYYLSMKITSIIIRPNMHRETNK